MSNRDKWNLILDALWDPYRRQLLVALLHDNPQDHMVPDPLEVVAERPEDAQTLQTEIVHTTSRN